MADEIARLGVAVDSSSAVSAERDLEALAVAGDRATASAKKLGGSWESMRLTPTQLYSANRGLADLRSKAAEASSAVSTVDNSWKKATFSPTQLYSANRALSNFKKELGQAKLASDQLATANRVQAASHHQVAKAAVGYTKSAKELAFATRNLPAQFTDIAVSLQAGQNPLTVLLQQGGQLKDMFGSVGGAARALGSYIMGLVNVWTIGAAALATFGIAYLKGDAEARKFHATLTLQGGVLGATTDSLVQASAEMERFGQSQGAAAAALNTTAASGKIFGDSIQTVAQAALNMERETGQAIDKTVEDFASLADRPVEAAIKLDEQYRFLTVSVYNQIRALEEQGDTMGAAAVAMDALASTMNERTAEIEANLGTLEKTWRLVANSAKWAWDQMLGIGRDTAVSDKIIELNDKIREINNPSNFMSFAHLGPKGSDARNAYVKTLQDEIRGLQKVYKAEQEKAAQQQLEEQARIASISLAEEAKRGATNSEKRVLERARIEAAATRAIAGIVAKNSDDRIAQERTIRENEAKAIAAMEKRLADPAPKKSKEARDTERLLRERARDYENLDQALDRHSQTLAAAGQAQDKLSSFEQFAIKTLSDLDNGHTALDLAQRQEIKTRIEALRVIDQENQAREKQEKIMAVSASLHERIARELNQQAQSQRREMSGIGRGQNEASLESALEDIRIQSLEERIKLSKQYYELNAIGHDQYMADLQAINDAEAQLINNEIAQMGRRREAMGDWRNGARAAMEDIAWEMSDVAGRTKDGFMSAFGAMNSALTTFANTGKLKIRDFATTVIAELLRIALTIAANKFLMSIFGGFMNNGGANAELGGSTYGQSNTYSGGYAVANGAAFGSNGQLISMARGGLPFSGVGGVRFSPTLSTMANGSTVLMAEQKPEAVMPLERMGDGRLGILSKGGGSSVVNVNTNITINQDGSGSSQVTADTDGVEARKLGKLVESKIRDVMVQEQKQGGILWSMAYRGGR